MELLVWHNGGICLCMFYERSDQQKSQGPSVAFCVGEGEIMNKSAKQSIIKIKIKPNATL
jgi:hypothetical protein